MNTGRYNTFSKQIFKTEEKLLALRFYAIHYISVISATDINFSRIIHIPALYERICMHEPIDTLLWVKKPIVTLSENGII